MRAYKRILVLSYNIVARYPQDLQFHIKKLQGKNVPMLIYIFNRTSI